MAPRAVQGTEGVLDMRFQADVTCSLRRTEG